MTSVAIAKRTRKYARIGEFVKIVTPKEFVRCGYPLSIKDVMEQQFEEIEKDCERIFAALEKKLLPVDPEPQPEKELGFPLSMLSVPQGSNMSATVHGMLCSAIAAYRLEKQNYGGNERIIVERQGPFEAGQLWLVTGKRLVKTGKRFSPSSYYSSYSGEYDYDPGGLENERTHCVYSVALPPITSKILADHCEFTS